MNLDHLTELWFRYKDLRFKKCGNFTKLDFAQLEEIVKEFNKFDPVYLKISGCNAGRIIGRIKFFLFKNNKITSLRDGQAKPTNTHVKNETPNPRNHYIPKF